MSGEYMQINEYFKRYKNHPILFAGSGISMRYLQNSYSWENLLKKISIEVTGNDEFFLDCKVEATKDGECDYTALASKISKEFDEIVKSKTKKELEYINDEFYRLANNKTQGHQTPDRMKIYIASIFSDYKIKEDYTNEITLFTNACKNISSIVTTNYDSLLEDITKYKPLIGNDILLENNYGSIYKIHGSCSDSNSIIISKEDYDKFAEKYKLIKAQLITFFIQNPIVFIGYSITDPNIKEILEIIYSYVPINSELSEKIKNNFLLVEWEKNSENLEITDYDIALQNGKVIRINKIKTDKYDVLYDSIEKLELPVSALDIKKVKDVVKDIENSGSTQVKFLDNIESLKNSDRVLAIGSSEGINYKIVKVINYFENYFDIINESNQSMISVIEELSIQTTQYFPVEKYNKIVKLKNYNKLIKQQKDNLNKSYKKLKEINLDNYIGIENIIKDEKLSEKAKKDILFKAFYDKKYEVQDYEKYLKKYIKNFTKIAILKN